jgi:hypothetical protein
MVKPSTMFSRCLPNVGRTVERSHELFRFACDCPFERGGIHLFRGRNHVERGCAHIPAVRNNSANPSAILLGKPRTNLPKHFLRVEHRFAFSIQFERVAFESESVDAILESLGTGFSRRKKSKSKNNPRSIARDAKVTQKPTPFESKRSPTRKSHEDFSASIHHNNSLDVEQNDEIFMAQKRF